MKVLVQGLVAAPGGSLSVLRDLVAAWPHDDELLVLAWRPPAVEALRASGHEVIAVRARSTAEALVRSRPRLGAIVRRFRPDVVWSQAVLIGAQRHGLREAIHYQDIGNFIPLHGRSLRRVVKGAVERRDLRRADLRIFNSGAVRAAAERRFPDAARLPSVVVHNGVDLQPFVAAANATAARRPGSPRLLLPQSDLPHKRNPLAADVLAAVRGADPRLADTTLTVAGNGTYDELRARATSLGLTGAITFLGHVPRDRMAQAYADADVVLITSSGESFCNPIVEAHAVGRPIVLPPLAVAHELEGPLSRIATRADTEALAGAVVGAMAEVLDGPAPELRAQASTFAAGFGSSSAAAAARRALSSLSEQGSG